MIVPRGRAPGAWSAIPPIAPPPAAAGSRPFWSVMIPTYEADDLLEATLLRVLEQDPGPGEMQIDVVDDASTVAKPDGVVEHVGGGQRRVLPAAVQRRCGTELNTCVSGACGRHLGPHPPR